MKKSEDSTRFERHIRWLKNHRVLSVVMVFGVVVIAIAAFMGAVSVVVGFFRNPHAVSETAYTKSFVDRSSQILADFNDVLVLNDSIVDAQKGYMRIRVRKDYLNSGFDMPVTLRYEHRRYQPVMLTFTNDAKWGPGVVFVSPEYERRAQIFLNQCFRFDKAFGRMVWSSDLVFEVFFNDYCIYFVPNDGEVRFERTLPPIRFGKNLCIGYFDPNDQEKNRHASKDFPTLEAYFQKNR